VLARGGPIDVLIHGAGGMPPSDARTREGVDRGFAQNFLGAFLLTRLLEERLLGSAPARVIALLMNHVIPFFVAAGKERGSEQYVRLATDPTLADVSGMYFVSGPRPRDTGANRGSGRGLGRAVPAVGEGRPTTPMMGSRPKPCRNYQGVERWQEQ
jgi:hypothetical protein